MVLIGESALSLLLWISLAGVGAGATYLVVFLVTDGAAPDRRPPSDPGDETCTTHP